MKTPLTYILEWFQSLEKEIQRELLDLCYLFHYKENIKAEYDYEKRIINFIDYLDSKSIDKNEVITRTLFTKNLFDFAFNGRDTEEGWDNSMDKNLDARSRLTEEGKSGEFIDKILEDWQSRKYFWINLANSWEKIKEEYLKNSDLDNWWVLNLK